jgi:hypothetical protein
MPGILDTVSRPKDNNTERVDWWLITSLFKIGATTPGETVQFIFLQPNGTNGTLEQAFHGVYTR